MYQPVSFFIGMRYVHGRTEDRFIRFVSWLSVIAIAASTMTLVTVLSIMNGFENELKNNILELVPQAIISPATGSLDPQQLPKETIRLKGINRISPLTTSDVVLQSNFGIAISVMLGIDPSKKDPLTPYLIDVNQNDLEPGKYNLILGKRLANQLHVSRGDQLRVIIPSVNQVTLTGRSPSQRLFNVIGTFFTNSEIDNCQFLINIQDASRLMHYKSGHITGWRLWLNQPLKVDISSRWTLPDGTKWQDWRERRGELFQAVRMEKNMMGLLLSLIVIVSVFSISVSLGLSILEKQREIAILQVQGMTSCQIMKVFIVQGVSTGVISAFLGTLFGILLTNHINDLILLIASISSLFDDIKLPSLIELKQIIVITLISTVIAFLSTLFPSWYASTIQPAETLRHG